MARNVLITGASIAGPVLAWWLSRFGMKATVVERSREFRDGGQNIDVRGAGRTVLQRMGLDEAVAQRSTGEEGLAFVDEADHYRAEFGAEEFGANGPTAEREILRGDLARLLYEYSRGQADYVFGDRIVNLDDQGDAVEVTLEKGGRHRFDAVIAAEGIGSSTRKLLFGEAARRVPLDLYTSYFTIPRAASDGKIARWFNTPGGLSVVLRPDNKGTTRAILSVQQAPAGYEDLSPDQQKAFLKAKFAGAGWETPRVLAALDQADDFYFEAVGQVKLERWSKGRIALVGDAAYCASPISGMGTSLALVGAYVLAGELSRHEDPVRAFDAYERIMRPYVEQAQNVPKAGPRFMHPQTQTGISLQLGALHLASLPRIRKLSGKLFSPPADKIDLPDYGAGTAAEETAAPA
jgi:2-polyprenyl-6-methoxyphenol hydroxylase-like FAD-dependent oxidoreductase